MSFAEQNQCFRLDELMVQQLPALLPGTTELIDSLSDDELEFDELVRIIEQFPGIVGRLISLANSAWSAPASSITSLENACSRLGGAVVKNTSIALAVARPFDPSRCPNFDSVYFWSTAMMGAEAASLLATMSPMLGASQQSTARTAGLLHNLGILWLVDAMPNEVEKAIESIAHGEAPGLGEALHRILGFDHAEAGGHLGRMWELPQPLVASMEYYRDSDFRGEHEEIVTTITLTADLVACAWKDQACPVEDPLAARLGLGEAQLIQIFEQIRRGLDKTRELAENLFSV